jgi:hypothetical protein
MPLSVQHRHAVLLADRTGDVDTITTVVTEVLAASPETTPLEIETALRDAAAQSYLIAGERLSIVLGLPVMLHKLAASGSTPEQNRAALVVRNK